MKRSLTNKEKRKMTKVEKTINFLALWIARLALSTLAFAGMIHLLGGVDPVILYPVSFVSVAFLLKETL